jgi:hypothetical protein
MWKDVHTNNVSAAEARRSFDEVAWMLGNGYLVSLYVYADESGTHDTSRYTVIAGWVSPLKRWKKFCGQWQRELNKAGAPYVHMREISEYERENNKKSPFYGWSATRADKFIHKMIPIARDNALFGLICAVSMEGYNVLTPEWKAEYYHPYIFTFRVFFEQLLKILNGESPMGEVLPKGKLCHMVFEQQKSYGADALIAFDVLKLNKPQGFRFGKMLFAESRGADAVLPLEAADMLANRSYIAVRQEIDEDKKIKADSWTDRLRLNGNLFVTYLNVEDCQDFVRRIKSPPPKSIDVSPR